MRVFAISDLHVDFEHNSAWVKRLSLDEYKDDILILAGDVADSMRHLSWSLRMLTSRFRKVLYVPGNHELWMREIPSARTSLDKFYELRSVVENEGASMQPFREGGICIVPLLGWYDSSFGVPSEQLQAMWVDYHACRWPPDLSGDRIAEYFCSLNLPLPVVDGATMISFSHFLPRLDLMPASGAGRMLYPVLGSRRLETQVRALRSSVHVYGHSHVNRRVELDATLYINNALGYPYESGLSGRRLFPIHSC